MSVEALFAVDVLQLSAFGVLVAWALCARRDAAAHKRLMILATVALMGPALSRWPFSFVFSSDLVFFGILDSYLIFMLAYDLWSRGRPHRVTIWGSLLLVFMDFSMRPLAHAAWWHQFTASVQNF
jgi:hypothetical protein